MDAQKKPRSQSNIEWDTRDDKFTHFMQGSTPNFVSNHSLRREAEESDRRFLQRSGTVSQEQYLGRDDSNNFSQVHLVRGSSQTIIQQQPLSRHLSQTEKNDDWQNDHSRSKVLISAPPYSNRVQPITDYRPPSRDYVQLDFVQPPSRDGIILEKKDSTISAVRPDARSLKSDPQSYPRSLRSSRVAPGRSTSQANDHLHFSAMLMFTCFLCFIPSGGLTFIGALFLLPALISAAVAADYNKEGKLKEARNLGQVALICSAVAIILTAVLVVFGIIGGIIALQLLVF